MSAADMAAAIKQKKVSPVEIVSALLARIETVNHQIKAYVTVTGESALRAAKKAEAAVMKSDPLGPLHGVPVSLKDLIFTRDVRTTMGSKLLAEFIPQDDSVSIARLTGAGAILLGKTNTSEFGGYTATENELFGITRNPWRLSRTSGGSSGGSAAAVAAGLGPLSIGSDGGGSIRIPAGFCGVFGLKPQFGRIPSYPPRSISGSFTQEGPITRTVKDAAIMLDVLAGAHWGDRRSLPKPATRFVKATQSNVNGLKAAWSSDLGYAAVSGEVLAICEESLRAFSELGARVEAARLDLAGFEPVYQAIMAVESEKSAYLKACIQACATPGASDYEPPLPIAARRELRKELTLNDHIRAISGRQRLSLVVGEFFERYDLLITPTMGVTAWKAGLPQPYVEQVDGKPLDTFGRTVLTYPFNVTGHPAASIPVGRTKEGLPVSLQLVGGYHDEFTVFKAATAFERIRPWADRKPPLK